ncbi:carbonic anhydrase 1 [Drosophila tropicalis]|uniref:carbonic anhydrase 1 n=1 Tax=Drosophila tropicalis TaxID=46794 RepID=UPI0035ABF50A
MWCWLSQILTFLTDWDPLSLAFAVAVSIVVILNVYSGIKLGEIDHHWRQVRREPVHIVALPSGSSRPSNNQSPINIETSCYVRSYFINPLVWSHYDDLPLGIRLENNGTTLQLRAVFPGQTPFIDGGDLLNRFSFHEISFRWGWYNNTGSEHTVDNQHYPLEMQCLHTDTNTPEHASSQSLLMVSYMFTLSEDNPYLDVLIQHLAAVQQAGQCVELPPFPLTYLMMPFYSNFLSYHGSLTEYPYHRGAEWFIWPYPLAIGERQLNEFRQLRNCHGARISWNGRPVQLLQDRSVYYNEYRC